MERNISIPGRSGVAHQIDVYWKFKIANVEHTVLIECKDYASPLQFQHVRSFFAVAHDIGNCQGLMVTKTGFQSGAAEFAKHYGIGLKILREPTEEDWKGRIKDIHFDIGIKWPFDIRVSPRLGATSPEQRDWLLSLKDKGNLNVADGREIRFFDKNRAPLTEEMQYWVPKQLDYKLQDGGPHSKEVELQGAFVEINGDSSGPQLVPVTSIGISYFLRTEGVRTISIFGEQIVKAILTDFFSGEREFTKRQL